MQVFPRAKNTLIGGHASFINNETTYNFGSATESLDEGIRLLLPHVVTGAMHNSRHRFDAPTCHPETRLAIQEDLLSWADELVEDLNEPVTWLYGPAGAGKSAIAQTIAQKLDDREQLTASFFFSRDGGGDGRGEETYFVATLAHQLSQNIPATKPHIAAAVRQNPLVFDLALDAQVETLIVAPLAAVSRVLSGLERPQVIVVDGLDECRKECNAQRLVVNALIYGLRRIPHHNHKLFITSRPEDNIVAIFNNCEEKLLRKMELNNKWNPDDDIRIFLNAGFADIRRSHFYFQRHPDDQSPKTWPSREAISTLVRRSSGQFIYASVVLKYIKSEEYYNPAARLQTILELKNSEDQPYAELDALYKYIFSRIREAERDRLLTILLLDRDYGDLVEPGGGPPFETFLSTFVGAHIDEINFWLGPLVSLLVPKEGSEADNGRIHYMHASLLDFLHDQSRSNVFCIHTPILASRIVRRAIELLADAMALKIPHSVAPLISILSHYASRLPCDELSRLVSNFNIVEAVLCKINADFISTGRSSFALTRYLEWVLIQSENDNALYYQKPAAQIRTWLVNQFEHPNFNYVDVTEQIDVWPFFTSTCPQRNDPSTNQLSESLCAALEICGSPLASYYQHVRRTEPVMSQETAVLCCLMPDLASQPESWLYRPDLLGQYAMTQERYGLALQRAASYVLQLPKHILLEILNGSSSDENFVEIAAFHLICDVLHRFLVSSPSTTDLYFLMGLLYPVMRRLGVDSLQDILTYIYQLAQQLPFLNDPTSSDYIQARAKVEESCVNLNIKISFHELAEMVGKEVVPYQHFV